MIGSRDQAVKAVAENADAIGFVLHGEALPESVIALTLDGKLPADAEYPIAN